MKIAIIDDGVNYGCLDVGEIFEDVEITSDYNVIQRNFREEYYLSHGTICGAILKKYYREAELISVKVLNRDNGKCMVGQLVEAINWCAQNNIKLMNISLGSVEYTDIDVIQKCVNSATKKGGIIIAAQSNNGMVSYPAFLSSVIGVRHGDNIVQNEGYIVHNNPLDGIDCEATSIHTLQKNKGGNFITEKANSYAAPYITAIVAKMLENNRDYNVCNIKERLYAYSDDKNKLNSLIDFTGKQSFTMLKCDFDENIIFQIKKKNGTCKGFEGVFDVPIIMLWGDNEKMAHILAKELKYLFGQNGYYAITVEGLSQKNITYRKGIFLDVIEGYKEFFCRIYKLHRPDLFIVYNCQKEMAQDSFFEPCCVNVYFDNKIDIYNLFNEIYESISDRRD